MTSFKNSTIYYFHNYFSSFLACACATKHIFVPQQQPYHSNYYVDLHNVCAHTLDVEYFELIRIGKLASRMLAHPLAYAALKKQMKHKFIFIVVAYIKLITIITTASARMPCILNGLEAFFYTNHWPRYTNCFFWATRQTAVPFPCMWSLLLLLKTALQNMRIKENSKVKWILCLELNHLSMILMGKWVRFYYFY